MNEGGWGPGERALDASPLGSSSWLANSWARLALAAVSRVPFTQRLLPSTFSRKQVVRLECPLAGGCRELRAAQLPDTTETVSDVHHITPLVTLR